MTTYRFYMDEREEENARHRRPETFGHGHGVWRCQTQFPCMEVCPKEIPVTEHIREMKREDIKRDLRVWS